MSQTRSFTCSSPAIGPRGVVRSLRFVAFRRFATGWRARALALALLSALSVPAAPAAADVVLDWNAVAEAVAPRFGGPQQQSRVQAMVQIAVHDALNAIEPRYARYTAVGLADPDASPDAAVASAGREVLLALLAPLPPSDAKTQAIATVESAFLTTVGPGPYDALTQAGIAAGAASAAEILALRTGDGSDTPHLPYTLPPGPGVYQPTPNPEFPAVITPSFAGWANVTPFALRHGGQFEVEPGDIFDLTSRAYAREYEEVRRVGDARLRGASPDSEESDVARFWPGGGSNWNLTTRVIVAGRGLDRWQHARLFALLNMAIDRWADRQPDLEVHLQLLAPGDGDPLGRRRQPGHGQRSHLAPVPGDPALPRLPLRPAHRHRGERRGPAAVLRHRPHRLHPQLWRPSRAAAFTDEPAAGQVDRAPLHLAVPSGRRGEGCPCLRGNPLRRGLPGRRAAGGADRPLRGPARAPAVEGLQAGEAVSQTPGRQRQADLIFKSACFQTASKRFSASAASAFFFCRSTARERP